jgi:hypothetical protein
MGKTHTGVLRRFGYYPAEIRRSAGLFHETEGVRYFQHNQGYVVALRSNGAWWHCEKNGTRIGEGQGGIFEGRGHGPDTLERHLIKFHGDKP